MRVGRLGISGRDVVIVQRVCHWMLGRQPGRRAVVRAGAGGWLPEAMNAAAGLGVAVRLMQVRWVASLWVRRPILWRRLGRDAWLRRVQTAEAQDVKTLPDSVARRAPVQRREDTK